MAFLFARRESVQFILLGGTLRDKVCSNHPHTEDGLKESIHYVVFSVSQAEL